AGVLIILRPGVGLFEPAALFPIVAALSYSLSALLTRRLGTTESGGALALTATAFYIVAGSITALALAGIEVPPTTHTSIRFLLNPWVWPDLVDGCLLALCGVIAACGFFLLSQGYRLAEANRAAAFEYAALPWAVLWGYLFFDTVPDAPMIIGAAIIIG